MTDAPVSAALFDVFGTVVDWRTGVAEHVGSWCARWGVEVGDPFAFADDWRARYQPAMEPIRRGERAFTRLDVLHRESLIEVLDQRGVVVPDPSVDELVLAWHSLPPWPDAVAGIARLSTRLIVAPLSNGNISLLLDMAKTAHLPWDAILGAEVARAYKPTPESYLRTADVLGLSPEQCLMVAAHDSDLAAAASCGLRTAFVRRPFEHGPDGETDVAPSGPRDHVVDSIEELATELGC